MDKARTTAVISLLMFTVLGLPVDKKNHDSVAQLDTHSSNADAAVAKSTSYTVKDTTANSENGANGYDRDLDQEILLSLFSLRLEYDKSFTEDMDQRLLEIVDKLEKHLRHASSGQAEDAGRSSENFGENNLAVSDAEQTRSLTAPSSVNPTAGRPTSAEESEWGRTADSIMSTTKDSNSLSYHDEKASSATSELKAQANSDEKLQVYLVESRYSNQSLSIDGNSSETLTSEINVIPAKEIEANPMQPNVTEVSSEEDKNVQELVNLLQTLAQSKLTGESIVDPEKRSLFSLFYHRNHTAKPIDSNIETENNTSNILKQNGLQTIQPQDGLQTKLQEEHHKDKQRNGQPSTDRNGDTVFNETQKRQDGDAKTQNETREIEDTTLISVTREAHYMQNGTKKGEDEDLDIASRKAQMRNDEVQDSKNIHDRNSSRIQDASKDEKNVFNNTAEQELKTVDENEMQNWTFDNGKTDAYSQNNYNEKNENSSTAEEEKYDRIKDQNRHEKQSHYEHDSNKFGDESHRQYDESHLKHKEGDHDHKEKATLHEHDFEDDKDFHHQHHKHTTEIHNDNQKTDDHNDNQHDTNPRFRNEDGDPEIEIHVAEGTYHHQRDPVPYEKRRLPDKTKERDFAPLHSIADSHPPAEDEFIDVQDHLTVEADRKYFARFHPQQSMNDNTKAGDLRHDRIPDPQPRYSTNTYYDLQSLYQDYLDLDAKRRLVYDILRERERRVAFEEWLSFMIKKQQLLSLKERDYHLEVERNRLRRPYSQGQYLENHRLEDLALSLQKLQYLKKSSSTRTPSSSKIQHHPGLQQEQLRKQDPFTDASVNLEPPGFSLQILGVGDVDASTKETLTDVSKSASDNDDMESAQTSNLESTSTAASTDEQSTVGHSTVSPNSASSSEWPFWINDPQSANTKNSGATAGSGNPHFVLEADLALLGSTTPVEVSNSADDGHSSGVDDNIAEHTTVSYESSNNADGVTIVQNAYETTALNAVKDAEDDDTITTTSEIRHTGVDSTITNTHSSSDGLDTFIVTTTNDIGVDGTDFSDLANISINNSSDLANISTISFSDLANTSSNSSSSNVSSSTAEPLITSTHEPGGRLMRRFHVALYLVVLGLAVMLLCAGMCVKHWNHPAFGSHPTPQRPGGNRDPKEIATSGDGSPACATGDRAVDLNDNLSHALDRSLMSTIEESISAHEDDDEEDEEVDDKSPLLTKVDVHANSDDFSSDHEHDASHNSQEEEGSYVEAELE